MTGTIGLVVGFLGRGIVRSSFADILPPKTTNRGLHARLPVRG